MKISQNPSNGTLRPDFNKSKNWDTTQNIYIEGDNLEVLKLLQKSYYNKIKMIYIDPPYNTGKDILYQNNFFDNLENYLKMTGQMDSNNKFRITTNTESKGRFHSNWLNMIYPTLRLAKNLLNQNGCIAISIDHYEINNLINICNEIFGEYNQLGIITVVHKPEGRQHAKFFSASNEFMLVYAKNKDYVKFNQVVLSDEKKKEFNESDNISNFKWKNFIRGDTTKNKKPNGFYPIYVSHDLKDLTLIKKNGYKEVLPIDKKGNERAWIVLKDGFLNKLKNNELKAELNDSNIEIYYKIREQQVLTTHWIDKKYNATANGTNVLKELMNGKVFDFPKSIYLIEDIIKIITNENDIILDFFSGSGTTAQAVMELNNINNLNQKFIMIQIPEQCHENSVAFKSGFNNICEIGEDRIRRAGDKIVKESGNKDLDIGFKVFKLDSSNLTKWNPDIDNLDESLISNADNIVQGRSELDLVYEIMLKYGIDLTVPVEEINIKYKKVYSVGFGALLVCLDDDISSDFAEDIVKVKDDLDSNIARVVFKDNGFISDSDKTNIKETLRANNISEFITI